MISTRAKAWILEPSLLVQAHFLCAKNPFDIKNNPDGYINFGTAENHLLWDLIEPKLKSFRPITESDTHYAELYGSQAFRKDVASMLSDDWNKKISSDEIVIGSGASAILDLLAYALCGPGDGVLIPSPYYSGFDHDLKRAEAVSIPISIDVNGDQALSVDLLKKTLQKCKSQKIRPRVLLLASPHNPLARVFSNQELNEFLKVAVENGLDCIIDEIYAHSVFNGDFTSARNLDESLQSKIHIVYGFAKDFSLCGYKTGILHSYDKELIAVARELAYFSPVSTDTQKVLSTLIHDRKWLLNLRIENALRLKKSFLIVSKELQRLNIPIAPTHAGVFAWINLGAYLTEKTFKAENDLAESLFLNAKVNLTPGRVFNSSEPGWYRLCYAKSEATIIEGIKRIEKVLTSLS